MRCVRTFGWALTAVGFGYPDWHMTSTDFTIERHADRTLTLDGNQVPARYYTTLLKVALGDFTAEVWTDDFGVILKSVDKMPFGTLTNTLE